MVFNRIEQSEIKSGFTIVELLVVIVVIAILAAITIVSYTGVTNRAKTAKALSNANAVQSYVETYNAEINKYPTSLANFSASTFASLSGDITLGTPTSGNGETTIGWCYYASGTGGTISYYKFDATAGVQTIGVGTGTGTCTAVTGAV